MSMTEISVTHGAQGDASAQDSHTGQATSRRVWDPSRSNTLELILTELVCLYRNGTLQDELRPDTLRQLGGDFVLLYHAGFKNEHRPTWAQERFPLGFVSLVQDLNQRLAQSGTEIKNTKRDVSHHGRLTKDSLDVIRVYQEEYRRGEVSRDGALNGLRDEHSILLSGYQQRTYFPEEQSSRAPDARRDEEIDARKAAIVRRIESIKTDLGVDLTIRECMQGLVFEAFVGVYLAHSYGVDNVSTQRKLPVPYIDLFGTPHRYVILDYFVNDSGFPQIVEVKLENSYEGILNSALPQLYAFENLTGQKQRVTVLYRKRCPFFGFAMEEGLPVTEELRQMNLETFSLCGRRLPELIHYLGIEDLLSQDPGAEVFRNFLPKLDFILEMAEVGILRQYEDALKRIASSNENIEEKLVRFQERASKLLPLSATEANQLFGSRISRIDGADSSTARIHAIRRDMIARREVLLHAVYQELFGETERPINEEQLARLEAAPAVEFNDAVLEVLTRREEASQERLRHRAAVPVEQQVDRVEQAYDSIINKERELRRSRLGMMQEMLTKAYVSVQKEYSKDRSPEVARNYDPAQLSSKILSFMTSSQAKMFRNQLIEFLKISNQKMQYCYDMLDKFGGDLVSYAEKCVTADLAERVNSGDQLRKFAHLVNEDIDKNLTIVSKSRLASLLKKLETKFKNQPKRKQFVTYWREMTITGSEIRSRLFQTAFNAMAEFSAEFIKNLPGAADDLRMLGMCAIGAKEKSSRRMMEIWAEAAYLTLSRQDSINGSMGILLERGVATETLHELVRSFIADVPRQLSFKMSDTINASIMSPPQGPHWTNWQKMEECVRSGETIKLESLISPTMRLYSAAFEEMYASCGSAYRSLGFNSEDTAVALEQMRLKSPQLVADFANVIDGRGLFTFQLMNDFLRSKIDQARVLQFFSKDAALQFLIQNNPPNFNYGPVAESYPVISEYAKLNRERFLDLCRSAI